MAENTNNIAPNEEALNQNNLTSDIGKTNASTETVQELNTTGTGQIAGMVDNLKSKTETTMSPAEKALEQSTQITQKNYESLQQDTQNRLAEDLKVKEEATARAQESATKINELNLDRQSDITSIYQKRAQESERVTNELVSQLSAEKDLALQKANLEAEEQKLANKQDLEKAERDIAISEQKASWAFNKLGLSFSSGIILEVQGIATRGATEIARLKINANKLEVDTQLEVTKISNAYTKDINDLITKNLDVQLKLDEDTANLIYNTQSSLILTEKEKEEKISEIEKEYRANKRAGEDNLRAEQERLVDRYVSQVKEKEALVEAKKQSNKVDIAKKMESGNWLTLSTAEKTKLAQSAGMSLTELNQLNDNYIASKVYEKTTALIGSDVILTSQEQAKITDAVRRLTSAGVGMEEAVQRAVNNVIQENPRYKKLQEVQKATLEGKIRTAKRAGIVSGGRSKTQAEIDKEELSLAIMQQNLKQEEFTTENLGKGKSGALNDTQKLIIESVDKSKDAYKIANSYQGLIDSGLSSGEAKTLVELSSGKNIEEVDGGVKITGGLKGSNTQIIKLSQ